MRVSNPRVILLENIRQSCIYKLNTQNIKTYWQYMIQFSDTCADINNPIFSEDCSKNIMDFVGIDHQSVDDCIKSEINSKSH
jgi:hypothetical protein